MISKRNNYDELNSQCCTNLFEYIVNETSFLSKSILKIYLTPGSNETINHHPGQYCKLQGLDGIYRPFSIVNCADSMRGIECHIRVSKKNQHILKNFVRGESIKVYGPCGKINGLGEVRPIVLIAEGIGLAAFNQLILSVNSFEFPPILAWSGRESDAGYFSFLTTKWLKKHSNIIIKNMLLDRCDIVNCALTYSGAFDKIDCYFAGSPTLRDYVEQHYIDVFNKQSKKAYFYNV